MLKKDVPLEKLNLAINKFYSSRLIIVDAVIAELLQTIVNEKELFAIVSESTNSFNFATEYLKCISRDRISSYFKLPTSKKCIVNVVTGILFQFDIKEMSIVEFVMQFFPSESSHSSYIKFVDNIMIPYKDAIVRLFLGEPLDTVEANIDDVAPIIPFSDTAKEECSYWLHALQDAVVGDSIADEKTRREYLTMIKGMLYVLDTRNPLLIKITYIGLKNTLNNFKAGLREILEINNILLNYSII